VTDTKCQDCHLEIAEERLTIHGLHSKIPDVGQCQTCHTEHQGREASITKFAYQNIDHQLLSGFSLASHQLDFDENPMNCESCHSQEQFASATLDCVSCHAKAEHDQVAEHINSYGSDCVPCHDGTDRMANFEHSNIFPLDGEHQNIECQVCHVDKVFAGTARECAGCHEEPDLHIGIFGLNCERCHQATAWLPAQLSAHTFLVDHGEEVDSAEITCETCHEKTYTEYPCYSCHEDMELKTYHAEVDIEVHENCVDCHPTGREGEADAFMEIESGI
jgi:hypothetical protein